MNLVYSREAIADLVRLRAFIAEKNPDAATRIGNDIVERVNRLRAFPEMGHAVTHAPEPRSIRDIVFGNYVVRYSVHSDAIIVLRVWHHFEDR